MGFGVLHALVSPSPLPPAASARLGSGSEDPRSFDYTVSASPVTPNKIWLHHRPTETVSQPCREIMHVKAPAAADTDCFFPAARRGLTIVGRDAGKISFKFNKVAAAAKTRFVVGRSPARGTKRKAASPFQLRLWKRQSQHGHFRSRSARQAPYKQTKVEVADKALVSAKNKMAKVTKNKPTLMSARLRKRGGGFRCVATTSIKTKDSA